MTRFGFVLFNRSEFLSKRGFRPLRAYWFRLNFNEEAISGFGDI